MISIVIPAFNRAELLPTTLRSLLNQSLPALEILVVDDGSSDRTAEIAKSFGDPVRIIRQQNAGPAAARNRGFKESRGEFIHFFDSDDVALPNKHEVQVRALEESGADIAYGPWVKGSFSENGFAPENHIFQQHGLPDGDLIKALLTNWSIVPHACLFRRTIVEQTGGFPEDLWVAEDQMMFLECLLAGAKVVHSPGTLELYRSDNSDKISGNDLDAGRRRHLLHWAQFLLRAGERCRKQGIDPRQWFGYRGRLAEILREMQTFDIEEPELETRIRQGLEGASPLWLYRFVQQLDKKRQGLECRLGRGRAHPCFRVGKMDEEQEIAFKEWEMRATQSNH
ncbi:glycosyltransferase family 2 protein [Haloferula chungangensis]|uniref:Glycosyltransferase family 2 protein n=1 Tax=Haloferula chungangensis TaxID=1048331 RepID=A0ABW2LA01_9BACT